MHKSRDLLVRALEEADIRVNGTRPWDLVVHNEDLFDRVVRDGTLGAGEAYMEGWWDCEALDVMFCKAIRAHIERRLSHSLPVLFIALRQHVFNMQSKTRSVEVARKHYNMDNALFASMLGPTMNYSCGYWKNARTLDEAQEAKMDLICRKLHLERGMRVLDIGCGWGGLARYMSEHFEVVVTGISIASEQIRYAKEKDTQGRVRWICDDYRNLTGRFDRIVSVGMFEHVGARNYATYMQKAHDLLEDTGLFLLHTIGANHQKAGVDPWFDKYIFPNGMLPSPVSVTRAIEGTFVLEDWENFGADYDKTLMAWYERFEKGLAEGSFACEEEVRRMYRYYLLSCAAAFRTRDIQLWQLVLSPRGVPGGYRSVR